MKTLPGSGQAGGDGVCGRRHLLEGVVGGSSILCAAPAENLDPLDQAVTAL